MRIVYYKLPDEPENIVVSTLRETFIDSEVALIFTQRDLNISTRYRVRCENGILSANQVEADEEFIFSFEDESNFMCVLAEDTVENAILAGRLIQRELLEHERFYDRMED